MEGKEIYEAWLKAERIAENSQKLTDAAWQRGEDVRIRQKKTNELKFAADALFEKLQRNPFVGCPVTVHYYSDCRAGQITLIQKGRILVQAFDYKEKGHGECEVLDQLDDRRLGVFSWREKRQTWIQVGHDIQHGVRAILGQKITYIDPNF